MLAEVEDAIIERCKLVLGAHVKTVEDLPGRWSEATLRAALRKTPGVYVAWGGGKSPSNTTNQAAVGGRYVVYVVTSHASGERERRRGNDRQVGAYELVERVAPAVHALKVEGIGTLELDSIDNLYSERFDKEGVVIYGIAYRLPLHFKPPLDANTLNDFELYTGTHQVGGDNDPELQSRAELNQEE